MILGKAASIPNSHQHDRAEQKAQPSKALWRVAVQHRSWLLLTYSLFVVENGIVIFLPVILGLAINDAIQADYDALIWLSIVYAVQILIGVLRRTVDTRVFTTIHSRLCVGLLQQQRHQTNVSQMAARCALARLLVDFFEVDSVFAVQSILLGVGSVSVLMCYDCWLGIAACCSFVPLCYLNLRQSRQVDTLHAQLNNTLENEVNIIERNRVEEVNNHFSLLASLRVSISDWEAACVCCAQGLSTGLVLLTLYRSSAAPTASAGQTIATLRYVFMFVSAVSTAPFIVQKMSHLRDTLKRIEL